MKGNRNRQCQAPNDPFVWLREQLDELAANSMLRKLFPRDIIGNELIVGNRKLINFGSNDYLGIAMGRSQSSLQTKAMDAPSDVLYGATASTLMCGFSTAHERLCERLAKLEKTEAAVVYPTGYAACCCTISALAGADDLILSDRLNHASLIDGCRLSKAERFIFPHRDHKAVKALLQSHRQRYRNAFIVTDSVFSMDGTCAPLRELAACADEFDAIMIVDEAHATGVLGEAGGGLCEALEVLEQIPIRIGTMSKALGAQGGFVAGPRVVIDYLLQASRSLIFSTAAPPRLVETVLESLDVVKAEPERRDTVLKNAQRLRDCLTQNSIKYLGEGTPIVPVVVGDPDRAFQVSQQLSERGFFVPPVRPPTVPDGSSRLRVSLTAAHTVSQIDQLAETLKELWESN